MVRQETILSVFVASPSDVDEERLRLEEVIHELNLAWSRESGVRLSLVRWETHAFPGFGEDAQAVINEQILNDYDIFIGLMWYRFGTPTGRSGSGTAEEFRRAKNRYDLDKNSVKLMIYFKDAPVPIPPSELDLDQLANAATFRKNLGNEGGLYWSFKTTDEFEKVVRLHLTRQVQKWRLNNVTKSGSHAVIEVDTSAKQRSEEDDEIGFLDLIEQFEDEFSKVVEITKKISSATTEIGEKMNTRTSEIEEFKAGPNATNNKDAKRLISKAASDMDQYVNCIEAELPSFSKHLNAGMTALTRVAAMSIEFSANEDTLKQAKENLAVVRMFRKTIIIVEGQITEFKDSITAIPRLTTVLNRSKRAMVNVVERLRYELTSAQTMAREAEESFEIISNNSDIFPT